MDDEKLWKNSPHKKLGKIGEFLKHIWNEIEPVVIEFFSYVVIIFLVYFVTGITESFIPEKIKDILDNIKYFLIVAIVGILTIRTIILVIIRSVGSLAKEGKKVFSTEDSPVLENTEESKKEVPRLESGEKSAQEVLTNATSVRENRSKEEELLENVRRKKKDDES